MFATQRCENADAATKLAVTSANTSTSERSGARVPLLSRGGRMGEAWYAARRNGHREARDEGKLMCRAGGELLHERVDHDLRRVAGDVSAVARDLAHERGAHEAVLRPRGEEDRVDLRREIRVRVGDLELVLEVGRDAKSAYDHARALVDAVLDEQAVERVHSHVREMTHDRPQELLALLGVEQRVLRRMNTDRDDDV